MPRYVVVESEDEPEQKTGRRTRAVTAAITDSPMRRSTRIRQGSVNPDGSSPESVSGTQVTRITRRRVTAAAGADTTAAAEQAPRVLRSRKNSASSVNESIDLESAVLTPKGRTSKRLSIVESLPGTPKPAAKSKRTTRAVSETKSPAPVIRITRRTRATSIEPEPLTLLTSSISTPTRRRRTQVSILPTEPVLTEEDGKEDENNESNADDLINLSDEPEDPKKTPKPKKAPSSRGSSSAKAKKSSKDDFTKEQNDNEIEGHESFVEKISEDSSATEISPPRSKSEMNKAAEPKLLNSGKKNQTENLISFEETVSPKVTQSSATKAGKRHSSDKSKELGMKIEDLLNKSADEQEKSPGNKENEKLNVSPEKIRKNLEFTVSNVNYVRGKSLGSSKYPNKSVEKKLNTSLDEQVLSKSKYAYVALRSLNADEKKLLQSSTDNKSKAEKIGTVESPKKNTENKGWSPENEDRHPKTETNFTKVDEIIVENELIEEFTLQDSDDSLNSSKVDFSLTVGEDTETNQKNTLSKVDGRESREFKNSFHIEVESDDEKDISKATEPKDQSRKSESGSPEKMETDEQAEEREAETEAEDQEIEKNSAECNEEEESVDTSEREKTKAARISGKVTSPEKKSLDKSDVAEITTEKNNQVSDSDSNAEFDNLFQNISAEEWNKNNSPKRKLGKEKASAESTSEPSNEATNGSDTDSVNMVMSPTNDSVKIGNKKRRSSGKGIAEKADESVETKVNESREGRKSLYKLNRSVQIEEQEDEKSKSEDENMEVDEEEIESMQDANSPTENIEEEQKQKSPKRTPKNKKDKSSPVKSSSKSNKSSDAFDFNDFSDVENDSDEDEGAKSFDDSKSKLQLKSRNKLNRNYSTVAVVDSESAQEDVTDPDCPSSDNSRHGLPGYLFNVESSEDEEEKSDGEVDKSVNTIDSDIAKEMNLAGDDDLQYSDNDVAADECRDSESEHSDENDAGSDMADFIVADDEVESSEYSDEEEEQVSKFRRILDKLSSSEGEDEQETEDDENFEAKKSKDKRGPKTKTPDVTSPESLEENLDNEQSPGADSEVNESGDKLDRKTKTPDVTLSESLEENLEETESPKLGKMSLNFSTDSEKTLSAKKSKKRKSIPDSGDTQKSASPNATEFPTSDKKLKKFNKSLTSMLDSTINLCTPESVTASQGDDKTPSKSPALDNSLSKKSLKKLRKSLTDDLTTLTPKNDSMIVGETEEEELLATPNNKEKKTPKSSKKNKRDSMQLIEDNVMTKPNLSDLNKSMLTPNSETPDTKFLKKERLNESLPLLELKKRASRMFEKTELRKMNEDEMSEGNEEENSETEEQKEIADDSNANDDGENEDNDDAEDNAEEMNDKNGHDEDADEEDEGTDQERNNGEENGEENDIEHEKEDENEESSEDEMVVKKKLSSSLRKSLSKTETEANGADLSPSKRKNRTPTSGALTNRDASNLSNEPKGKKKRARLELESSETPIGLKQTKKMKITSKNSLAKEKDSDSDEAPESLGFSEARDGVLKAMKDVASSLKSAKEAKKKKRRDQLEKIRQEKEAKSVKKTNLKRLPEDLLENISEEVPERPKKKRKLIKKEVEQVLPSRYMFSPGKSTDSNNWEIDNCMTQLSTGIGTTHFSVVNLEKVQKHPKKAIAVASFRERMLARNVRQPVSAFLVHQAKQKASGKGNLPARKKA